nr:hypothetical protein B0A51_01861 [Rachicladosporium sp. CCFEE 5018]
MGVPALFRWLSQKYPKIISPVIEEAGEEVDNGDGTTTKLPIDARGPNPNGEEMDNLYLDMNGIVHPCSHPEDRPPPANEEEMMIAVFEYTERVVNMCRPRKLLMIAVDGVAPRAKMNQQRSRRFRSAQEAAEKDKAVQEYHEMMASKGQVVEGAGDEKPAKTWDSNAITPGTPFMDILAASLRYWVSYKLSTDPAWEKLKVIISDATVPGEGEHKIMNFVRSQRQSPTHDPNTRHVIYGLDADLIMLGLATHEPHFRVLREDVFANDTKPGHCPLKEGEDKIVKPLKPFIWLHVGVLREYLAVELSVPQQPFAFDLERALDDWVFMCFFVGNDFLPHLPSLDIRENGIDTLIAIWRDNIPHMGGYVTKDGHVDLTRAQTMLQGLAKQEDAIFKRRRQTELHKEAGQKRREEAKERRESGKRQRMSNGPSGFDETVIQRGTRGGIRRGVDLAPDINALPTFAPGQAQTANDPRYQKPLTHADIVGEANAANKSAAAAMKERLMQSKNPAANQRAELDALFAQASNGDPAPVLGKRTRDMIDDAADEPSSNPSTPGRNTPNKEVADPLNRGTSGALGGTSADVDVMPEDTVKLWEEGYADRYYEQKFHAGPEDIAFRNKVAADYVEGLCWVLLYYFQGCPSWTWYYPHHYAPFAADFINMESQVVEFKKGKPFRPYEQLMGVMPARSNHTIPAVFHPLMTDEDSPIIEFYPLDFDIDLNGKKFAWQGVALLPWIDEKRLLDAMDTKYPLLTEAEVRRNTIGNEALIFSTRHPLYEEVASSFYTKKATTTPGSKVKISSKISEGLAGKMAKSESYIPNATLEFPLPTSQDKFTDLEQNEAVTVHYHMPQFPELHKSMLLPGIKFNEPMLDYSDIQTTREKANKSGRSHGGVQLSQNGDRSDGRRINYGAQNGNGNGHNNGGGYQGNNGYGPNGGYGSGNGYGGPPSQGRLPDLPPQLAAQAARHFPGGMPPQMPQGYPPQQNGRGGGGGYGDRGGYERRDERGYGGQQNVGGGYGGQRGGGQGGYGGGYRDGGSGYANGAYRERDVATKAQIDHNDKIKQEDTSEMAELPLDASDSTGPTTLGKRKRGAGIVKLEVEQTISSPRRSSRKVAKVEEGNADVKTPSKAVRSPAKRIAGPNGTAKTDPPANWEEVYAITTEMRKRVIAPVDTMGCEDLAEKTRSPRDQRLQTLIALMLSSQTKDPVTAAAIRSLQEGLPGGLNLESLLEVEPEVLNRLIQKVGFHNNKTKYIKATALLLRDNFASDIPDTIDGLISLPGVGPKMAYLTMSAAWGRDEGIGVDVHVHRITNLWGWHKTSTPEQTRAELESWLPKDKWHHINHLLVGFGQMICLPVGRRCGECELQKRGLCPSAVEGSPRKRAVRAKVEVVLAEGVKEEGVVKVEEDEMGVQIEVESEELGSVEVQATTGATIGNLEQGTVK